MHVYKTLNLTRFENGEVVIRKELKGCGALEFPYKFIQTYGLHAIGVNDLPKGLFSKEYCCPAVTKSNIWEKIQAVESMFQDHEIDISINLYVLSENKVHNTMVTSDKTVAATRVTSSITLLGVSKTSRPRHHNTSFNFGVEKRLSKNMSKSVSVVTSAICDRLNQKDAFRIYQSCKINVLERYYRSLKINTGNTTLTVHNGNKRRNLFLSSYCLCNVSIINR